MFSDKGTNGGEHEGDEVKLPYLALPLMVGMHVTEKLNVMLGIETGYLLDDRQYHRDFDMGVNLDASCEVINHLHFALRYNFGISSIYGKDFQFTDDTGNVIDLKIPNRVLQVSMYYFFKN